MNTETEINKDFEEWLYWREMKILDLSLHEFLFEPKASYFSKTNPFLKTFRGSLGDSRDLSI